MIHFLAPVTTLGALRNAEVEQNLKFLATPKKQKKPNKTKLHYERKKQTKRQPPLNPFHLTDTSATDLPVSFDVTKSMPLHITIRSSNTGMHFTPQSGETALALPNILPEGGI